MKSGKNVNITDDRCSVSATVTVQSTGVESGHRGYVSLTFMLMLYCQRIVTLTRQMCIGLGTQNLVWGLIYIGEHWANFRTKLAPVV